MEFEGKVAVVTGAASGIGRAVAMDLARRNIRAMALVDLGESIDAVAVETNAQARRQIAFSYRGDVTDPAFPARIGSGRAFGIFTRWPTVPVLGSGRHRPPLGRGVR